MPKLISLFAGLTHIRDVGLKRAADYVIWDWAKTNGYAIITTDSDFVAMNHRFGWPPKVIQIEHCDFPFRIIEDLIRRNAVLISEFDKDPRSGLLVLRLGA